MVRSVFYRRYQSRGDRTSSYAAGLLNRNPGGCEPPSEWAEGQILYQKALMVEKHDQILEIQI